MKCLTDQKGDKATFLRKEGTLHEEMITWKDVPKDYLPVILTCNGNVVLITIAYSEKELEDQTIELKKAQLTHHAIIFRIYTVATAAIENITNSLQE
ncbi:MAG: hypothetical protein WCJ51_01500 [Candidatus Moraniibacteriota bacterium]